MDISFIIPTRNDQKTLELTIVGLRRSCNYNYQIIVIDDYSFPPISLEPSDDLLLIRNSQHMGVSKSRNRGAEIANGKILFFMDSHVFLTSELIEFACENYILACENVLSCTVHQIKKLRQLTSLAQNSSMEGEPDESVCGYYASDLIEPNMINIPFSNQKKAFKVPGVSAHSLWLSREFFFRLGRFEDQLDDFGSYEDLELSLRTWAMGFTVLLIPFLHSYHYYDSTKQSADYIAKYKESPFEVRHYSGSLSNAFRVILLHVPENILQKIQQHYSDKLDLDSLVKNLLTPDLIKSQKTLENSRVRSKEWVVKRMTSIEFD
jgi:glycosyltransferase involved in cell wall biosynthesis